MLMKPAVSLFGNALACSRLPCARGVGAQTSRREMSRSNVLSTFYIIPGFGLRISHQRYEDTLAHEESLDTGGHNGLTKTINTGFGQLQWC